VDAAFFKPEIVYTTTGLIRDPYVEFRITLVATKSNTPVILDELIASFIDIDGNNRYREYNSFSTPERYTVDDPKEITVGEAGSDLLITGSETEYDGIFNSHPQVNISAGYTNISSFVVKFGIVASAGNNFSTPRRQSGIQFSCLDNFVNPQASIMYTEDISSGKSIEANGVVYPNPVQDVLNIQSDVPGEVQVAIFDMNGHLYYNATATHTGKPITIDVSSIPKGLLFVRIKNKKSTRIYTVINDN
jgi:hypothetical protein